MHMQNTFSLEIRLKMHVVLVCFLRNLSEGEKIDWIENEDILCGYEYISWPEVMTLHVH